MKNKAEEILSKMYSLATVSSESDKRQITIEVHGRRIGVCGRITNLDEIMALAKKGKV